MAISAGRGPYEDNCRWLYMRGNVRKPDKVLRKFFPPEERPPATVAFGVGHVTTRPLPQAVLTRPNTVSDLCRRSIAYKPL
jgi:hypothetical protein